MSSNQQVNSQENFLNSEIDINNPKRNFKGIWIPAEIWLNGELSYLEKMLCAEIDSLDDGNGCYASNSYFMKFFKAKERTIQQAISNLKKLGLIEQIGFDGRIRRLKFIHCRGAEKCTPEVQKNSVLPQEKERTKEKEYIYNKKDIFIAPTLSKDRSSPEKIFHFDKEIKKFINISEDQLKTWKDCFKEIDVELEIKRAELWCDANPQKAQKKKNWKKFFNNWLSSEVNKLKSKEKFKEEDRKLKETINKVKEIIPNSLEARIIQKDYENWYNQLHDPLLLDKGFLKIEDGKFYDTKNPKIKYNFTSEKALDYLEKNLNVNPLLIKSLKEKISKISKT